MEQSYDSARIEREAQEYWRSNQSFRVTEDPARKKFYCLSMFPYPSGRLHMGHVRNYTIGDVIARYQRMLGKNVLQPMGWDAFGLPAENAAMKNRTAPAAWTRANIEYMREQLKRLGFAYDWARELATCDPDYYKWEQWLFTELYRRGMVYRKHAVVNWDPVDQTVLANEQVIDGRGWRSGALVERREIPQWFIKITAYADELLDELDRMQGWPEQVCVMQRNWIGRSYGVEMDFPVEGSDDSLTVYTTRPDTVMGVTYVAVAAEHPLALRAAADNPGLQAFIEECRQGGTSEAELETAEKKGWPLQISALHPITGETVPVFAANFVLMGYGSGAVMAVPGHDQRDWEFAERYGIEKKQVIIASHDRECGIEQGAFTDSGVLTNSAMFDGLTSAQAFDAVAAYLEARGRGRKTTNYRLRDWGVSRQRYWGTPIPMIHCPHCGVVPVPEDDLPVRLPEDVAFDESTINPLKADSDFIHAICPACGGPAERETDTFDTFMESSWYYARYACPDAESAMLDQRADYWLPVDHYIGGIEHAILHLLYARFFHKLLRDVGLLRSDEPFMRLLTQGMVVADTFYRQTPDGKRHWYNPLEVDVERDEKGRPAAARHREDHQPVAIGGVEKMSKSKNNGVDPQALIEHFGADTVRLYTMFTAPPDQSLEWSDEGVEGSHRFLKRLWSLAVGHQEAVLQSANTALADLDAPRKEIRREIHEALKQAVFDYERQQFNTVVSACMKIVNNLYKLGQGGADQVLLREGLGIVLRLLAPITPHVAHDLWRRLDFGADILESSLPQPDPDALRQDEVRYVVQVNGKVRARIVLGADADRLQAEQAALSDENVRRFIGELAVRKVIVVPGKLVNVVVS